MFLDSPAFRNALQEQLGELFPGYVADAFPKSLPESTLYLNNTA